jgi:hypothetical protein
MSFLIHFQIAIICLALTTIGSASASPLSEWEGLYAENEAERGEAPRGWVDDTMIPVPENNLEENTNPLMEVTFSPQRQMQASHKGSHIDLAKVPVTSISTKDIKDETKMPRDKDKKKPLPDFLLQEKALDSDMLAINQVAFHIYN